MSYIYNIYIHLYIYIKYIYILYIYMIYIIYIIYIFYIRVCEEYVNSNNLFISFSLFQF